MFPSLTDSFVSSLLPLGPAAVNSPFRSPLPSHIQLSIGAGLPLPLPHSGFAEAKVLFFYSPSPLFSPLRNETQFRPLSFLPLSLSICRRPRPPLHRPFRACVPSLWPWPRPADARTAAATKMALHHFSGRYQLEQTTPSVCPSASVPPLLHRRRPLCRPGWITWRARGRSTDGWGRAPFVISRSTRQSGGAEGKGRPTNKRSVGRRRRCVGRRHVRPS